MTGKLYQNFTKSGTLNQKNARISSIIFINAGIGHQQQYSAYIGTDNNGIVLARKGIDNQRSGHIDLKGILVKSLYIELPAGAARTVVIYE